MTPGVRHGAFEQEQLLHLRHPSAGGSVLGEAQLAFLSLAARLDGGAVDKNRTAYWGIGLAFLLIAALPFAIAYAVRMWVGRFKEGQLTFQARDMTQAQVWATISLIVYVALLISSDTLASHTAQTHGGRYPWEPVIIVLMVEGTKLFFSIILRSGKDSLASDAPPPPSWLNLATAAVRLTPVAALYAGNNCLVFFVLARVELGAYVVWRNTTVFFNALLWTFVLRRALRSHQWIAVGFLFAGCLLNSLDTDGTLSEVIGFPVLLLLASAFASALAGAMNEAILKTGEFSDFGVDRLNCLLYSQTFTLLLTYLLIRAVWEGRPLLTEVPHLMSKLDTSAGALVAMQATLGLAVSRVLLYADAVAKTMAGGAREIVQAGIAPLFVASRLDWISFPSVIWIAVAMVTYFVPPKV